MTAAGYEAAKTYIRRYDKKIEYCTRDAPINDCQRSYLSEEMPLPDASFAVFEGEELAGDGVTRLNHFVVDEDGGRERVRRNMRVIVEGLIDSGWRLTR